MKTLTMTKPAILPTLSSVAATLEPTPPFDLCHSLRFIAAFPPTHGEQAVLPDALWKALRLDGRTILAEVRDAATPSQPRLSVNLHYKAAEGPLPPALRDRALLRLRRLLSLDDDLTPFYAEAERDPCFAPVARRLRGLHQVRFPTPFEIAAWAVLTQRTRIPAARSMKNAITELICGNAGAIDHAGVHHTAFPEASEVAAAGANTLATVLGAGPRASRIGALARAFCDVDDQFLYKAHYQQVETWLRGLPGIGPWSAAFILLRGLGRTELIPVGEARLDEAVKRVYGTSMDAKEMSRVASRYGALQGYWAYYLRVNA